MSKTTQNTMAVTNQPVSLSSMNLYHSIDEKNQHEHHNISSNPHACECESNGPSASHKSCHNSRLRRFLVPALIALLTIGAVLALSCFVDFGGSGMGSLLKRATDDTSSGDTFTNRKCSSLSRSSLSLRYS